MPTTKSEATAIHEITSQYLTSEQMRELFIRLDDAVGKHTDNDSLKQSLRMLRMLVDPPLPPARWWMWPAFGLLVAAHLALVVGITISFLILPFLAPWYIAMPLMVFVFFFSTTRVECQLTNLENRLRRRLGMKKIGGFVGFYLLRPAKRMAFGKRVVSS